MEQNFIQFYKLKLKKEICSAQFWLQAAMWLSLIYFFAVREPNAFATAFISMVGLGSVIYFLVTVVLTLIAWICKNKKIKIKIDWIFGNNWIKVIAVLFLYICIFQKSKLFVADFIFVTALSSIVFFLVTVVQTLIVWICKSKKIKNISK